jgi:hypothetical protein
MIESNAAANASVPIRARAGAAAGGLAYVAGYIALLAWFKWVDVYHAHFATAGPLVAVYNLFRVLFIFYLFWMVHAVGALALHALNRASDNGIGRLENLALGFFMGAGLWHVVLLALGYLSLYTVPVAIALTVPVVGLSYFNVRAVAADTLAAGRSGIGMPSTIWAMIVVLLGAALLLVKGLYPGGGHDYITHYFHFYRAVIDHGGVWPNEVWYHYYYSKGAGLYFLAMLLTDPLAPQLVTSCMMAGATLVLFLFCRQAAPSTAWPWIAVATFLFAYIYTPLWGEFEKLHELNTAFVIAILWMGANALASPGTRAGASWLAATASAIAGAVIVNVTVAMFLGAVFVLLALWYLARRMYPQSLIGFGLATVTGVVLVGILAVNYLTTGLINDQGIEFLWQFADLDRLDRSGILPLVIKLHWGAMGFIAERLPLDKVQRFLIYSTRYDLFYPLVFGGFLAAVLAAVSRRRSGRKGDAWFMSHHAAVVSAAAVVFVIIALAIGRAQPVSFFRYASFFVPVMIAGAILLWSWARSNAPDIRLLDDRRIPLAIFALTLVTTVVAMNQRARLFDTVLPRAWSFATGMLSIDAAYTQENGPYNPWGAIHPGARGAYAVVGPRTPIRSLHTRVYCMLPDCRMESVESFGIGRPWETIMFGTPEEARDALKASGYNYFLFTRELPLDDYLPRSPLFASDNIANYLGIRWTDGTTALLTWIGPDTKPFDGAWLTDYRGSVAASGAVASFPYEEMRAFITQLKASPRPWRSFPLTWRGK